MPYRRIALRIQYLGSRFYGWQRQAARRTVQGVLEEAKKDIDKKKKN